MENFEIVQDFLQSGFHIAMIAHVILIHSRKTKS